MQKCFWAFLVVPMGLVGCTGIKIGGSGLPGSGKVIADARKVGNFQEVRLDGVGAVQVKVGPAPKLVVHTDDNLKSLIVTEVKGNVLHLSAKKSINPTELRFEIETPSLSKVEVNGAGAIEAEGIKGSKFEAMMDGAGALKLSGQADELTLNVDGVGAIEAYDLRSKKVTARVDGTGSIECLATDIVDAEVNGVGSIRYREAKTAKTKVNGVGSIKRD